jgi:hypothetical protein
MIDADREGPAASDYSGGRDRPASALRPVAMSGMRIRWESAGKVIAGVAAALVIIGLAPSVLAPKDPEPIPADVGLAPPPVMPAPAPAKAEKLAKRRLAAERRKAAERRRAKRRKAKLAAAIKRQERKRSRRGDGDGPAAVPAGSGATYAYSSPSEPPPPPSAAAEFGFER